MEKEIKIGLAILLFLCLIDMPYGYYQFVRFAGMIGFAILAFNENETGSKNWAIFWIASAILINPIFKISLGRELWNIVDVIWGVVLLATLFLNKNTHK